jgi:hypothetical protein
MRAPPPAARRGSAGLGVAIIAGLAIAAGGILVAREAMESRGRDACADRGAAFAGLIYGRSAAIPGALAFAPLVVWWRVRRR